MYTYTVTSCDISTVLTEVPHNVGAAIESCCIEGCLAILSDESNSNNYTQLVIMNKTK